MTSDTRSDTVDRIAAVALDLLESKGPEAVTMRAVAQAVGITPMAIYHHFDSRETLLQAVTEREFERLLGYLEARRDRLSPRTGPKKAMLEQMHGYIDYALKHPRLFDYVFSQPRPDARRFPEDFRAGRSPTMTPLAVAVEQAMSAGWLKKDDVWEVTMQLAALTHGYVVLYRGGRFSYDEAGLRACCERAMERTLDGLRKRS